jgi:hypothetical protein
LPAYRIFVEFPKSATGLENTIAKNKKGIRGSHIMLSGNFRWFWKEKTFGSL